MKPFSTVQPSSSVQHSLWTIVIAKNVLGERKFFCTLDLYLSLPSTGTPHPHLYEQGYDLHLPILPVSVSVECHKEKQAKNL